ncbi:MAG: hypothetical protein WBS20_12370, partial [Lysobacterales bacterium]
MHKGSVTLPLKVGILLTTILLTFNLKAEICYFATFESQLEIDNISIDHPGCTGFASLAISGPDIVDLTPFSGITYVGRGLAISDNDMLESLEGLSGIADVVTLVIEGNERLADLTGLNPVLAHNVTVKD